MAIDTTAKEGTPQTTQKPTSGQSNPGQRNVLEQERATAYGTPSSATSSPSTQSTQRSSSSSRKDESRQNDQDSSGSQALSGELNKLRGDIEELIKNAASYTGEELTQMKDMLYERFSSAQESLKQVRDQVSDQAQKGVNATDEYVHQKPWQAIGVGAVAGLILGLVLSRR